jgi:hypothetical protein
MGLEVNFAKEEMEWESNIVNFLVLSIEGVNTIGDACIPWFLHLMAAKENVYQY